MSLNLATPRLLLTYEPDVETLTGIGLGRCGVYYLWHEAQSAGAISMTGLSRSCGEVGYEIKPEFRGRGFATEAVAAVMAAVPYDHGFTLMSAQARAENIASRRVLEKNGFGIVAAKLCWSETRQDAMSIVKYRRLTATVPQ